MTELFRVLEIICPTCGNIKNINVPESIFSQKKFGTIKIQIPVNAVCSEHQFIVFVDTRGVIRGYEPIDVFMSILSPEHEREALRKINLRNLIQTFGIYGIFNLIHAKVFNYPVYIIKNNSFEYNEDLLNSIGDSLLPERYKGNKTIHIIEDPDVNKIKIKDKNSLIMDLSQRIFQTPWTTKLKFEEEIIKRALEIIDEEEQIKLLQQDIANFFSEVHYTISILQDFDEIYEEDLVEKLFLALNIKRISNYRLNLIKEFIKRNISRKIVSKIKNRVVEFLSVI
ncbi:MAG: hypothetical protein ACFFEY_04475 [Candidatus Thorarchaeota archaeon]